MSTIKVHAGDFEASDEATFHKDAFQLTESAQHQPEIVDADQIESIEIATEDNVRKWSSTLGLGAAGGVLFGPLGVLAGLAAPKEKQVTFIAHLKDGRKLLATADSETYAEIQAAAS